MKIGITGTRRGWTTHQEHAFHDYLKDFKSKIVEFHHGDCVGVDEQAHETVIEMLPYVVTCCHPPKLTALRAFTVNDTVYEPEGYMDRNRAIVDAVDVMIAIPWEYKEVLRSGTWSTIRYARHTCVPLLHIDPQGRLIS